MMLELVRELLQPANTDAGHPIPVVLTLSSWALRREPLDNWIVRELAARCKIPEDSCWGSVAPDTAWLVVEFGGYAVGTGLVVGDLGAFVE